MDRGTLTTLGDWLAYLLKQAHWTQIELEAASRVSTDTISNIINGVVRARQGRGRGPAQATRVNLAKALADHFDLLTKGTDPSLSRAEADELIALTGRLLTAPAGPARRGAAAPIVVPSYLTPLVGRAGDVERAAAFLRRTGLRLLTLTGPPGVGKTRLGVAAALAARDAYADGIRFVALAPLRDSSLVMATIARALDLHELAGRSVVDVLVDDLRGRRLLLLLDNVEHLSGAAPRVADLLAACPRVTVLATSRSALRVDGEQELPVLPLATPDLARAPSTEEIGRFPAVDLFVQRARGVAPDFALTEVSAPTVAAICRRVDGLPLAIELAAARIRVLPPVALLARLDRRLSLLTGGPAHLPERQRTLRAALDWSHDLLDPGERDLYRRLAVFAGGCTLDAAEAVCTAPSAVAAIVLDGLASLADKSLLRVEEMGDGDARYAMLEVVREHAGEQLAVSGDTRETRDHHCDWCLELALRVEPELTGANQERWLARLEVEHDNLRAALRWTLQNKDAARALRLVGALWRFWHLHAHLTEGRRWIAEALEQNEVDNATDASEWKALRAKAWRGAGGLAFEQGDYEAAGELYEAAAALYGDIGDSEGIAASLNNLGVIADSQGQYTRAVNLFERSLALKRERGDTRGVTTSLSNLGRLALQVGDIDGAVTLYEEGLALSRALEDTASIALSLNALGEALLCQGEYGRAAASLEESIVLARRVGDKRGLGFALANLGEVALALGDDGRAWTLQEESVQVRQELGNKDGTAVSLAGLGDVARARGNHAQAAHLYGQSLSLMQDSGDAAFVLPVVEIAAVFVGEVSSEVSPPNLGLLRRTARLLGALASVRADLSAGLNPPRSPALRAANDRAVATIRRTLGDELFAKVWVEEQGRPVDQVLAQAIVELREALRAVV